MPDPSRLRDSTQIVLPAETLNGFRERIEDEFTVSIVETDDFVRIIASPVVIKQVGEYLARQGVNVP